MATLFRDFIDKLPAATHSILLNEFLFNDLVGINITDNQGHTIFLNDAHTRITGHPKEMYLGTSMFELEKEGKVSKSASAQVILTGKETTLRQKTDDGNTFEVRGIPVFDNDQNLIMVVCMLTDITEIVNTQQKINEMVEYTNILKQAISNDKRMVYQSSIMTDLVEKSKRVADTDVSVLITGPSGVGKELFADIIHENSSRKNQPFIKINCAAIPEQLLESELFGYEPGAFTGGNPKGKKGLIESANGGSLLLDEIAELPLMLQSKLLRALQERQIRRIGSNTPIDVDFRLISATNVDLLEKTKSREFREDLYYRINVIELKVPPLAKRKEDIPLLIRHFLGLFNAKYDLNKHIESDAVSFLCQYDYPGNVRELRNIVERLLVQSPRDFITIGDTYESMGINRPANDNKTISPIIINNDETHSLKEMIESHEKLILSEYIKIYRTGSELAKVLKTDQSTISRKLTKYGIKY